MSKTLIEAATLALKGQNAIVIDTSVVIDVLIGDPTRQAKAYALLTTVSVLRIDLIAPPLFTAEVDTALRQAVHRKGLTPKDLPKLYRTLDLLPIQITSEEDDLKTVRLRARELAALLDQPSVYDCTYAALAELLSCQYWTADARFFNVASQVRKTPTGDKVARLPFVHFVDRL